MMLICMLAFIIGVVFVIQVVGWSLEDSVGCNYSETAVSVGHPPMASRGARDPFRPDKATPSPSPFLYASGAASEGAPSSGFLPLPTDTGTLAGRRWGTQSMPATPGVFGMGSSGGEHGEGAMFAASPQWRSQPPTTTLQDPSNSQDAICPALILPHGEAHFSVPVEGVLKLGVGQFPVEILGPSGRPLLHARLPAQPVGNAPAAAKGAGRWLELTTTATSRYPHACVGPVTLGSPAIEALEIRGPKGNAYGLLEPGDGGWLAKRGGRVVLRIAGGAHRGLQAFSSDEAMIATATPGGERLSVQVSPGVDALLTLLCMLAVVLMSQNLAGMRQ